MNLHANARTCPNSRELLAKRVIKEGWSHARAADGAGVSKRTVAKWVARRRRGESMADRSSAPRRVPSRTDRERIVAIERLRRLRMTASEIAEVLGMALSTVSLWLRRIGLGKRSRLEPPETPNRYERSRPGELIHVDVKRLGRFRAAGKRVVSTRYRSQGAGWECCHVAIDDATRLAFVEVLPDERGETAAGFLRRAIAWFAEHDISVERVMTDNGSPFRSAIHAETCGELGLKHLRTRPYRPQTNGKAERFIQTMLREWAYGRLFSSSRERREALPFWLDHYNFRRRHGSLGHRPPGSRLAELQEQPG